MNPEVINLKFEECKKDLNSRFNECMADINGVGKKLDKFIEETKPDFKENDSQRKDIEGLQKTQERIVKFLITMTTSALLVAGKYIFDQLVK